jgi:hypothetical protein
MTMLKFIYVISMEPLILLILSSFIIVIAANIGSVFGQTSESNISASMHVVGNNTIKVTGNTTQTTKAIPGPLATWLAHPLLLLLIGGAISGILIPLVTRRWQDHQKEIELKIGLVNKINESLTDIVTAMKLIDCKYAGFDKKIVYDAYREWEKSNAVILSQLGAYFPNSDIKQKWDDYSQLVFKVYSLIEQPDVKVRIGLVQEIKDRVSRGTSRIDPQAVAQNPPDRNSWNILKQEILNEKNDITQSIIMKPMPLFSLRLSAKIRQLFHLKHDRNA